MAINYPHEFEFPLDAYFLIISPIFSGSDRICAALGYLRQAYCAGSDPGPSSSHA